MAVLGKEALDALKMTDAEIATRVGVSERSVRAWRTGGGMKPDTRRELARLLRERIVKLSVAARALEDA